MLEDPPAGWAEEAGGRGRTGSCDNMKINPNPSKSYFFKYVSPAGKSPRARGVCSFFGLNGQRRKLGSSTEGWC